MANSLNVYHHHHHRLSGFHARPPSASAAHLSTRSNKYIVVLIPHYSVKAFWLNRWSCHLSPKRSGIGYSSQPIEEVWLDIYTYTICCAILRKSMAAINIYLVYIVLDAALHYTIDGTRWTAGVSKTSSIEPECYMVNYFRVWHFGIVCTIYYAPDRLTKALWTHLIRVSQQCVWNWRIVFAHRVKWEVFKHILV